MTWQNAVAVIYVSAVALYVAYGFTIKDTTLKEMSTKDGIVRTEITNSLLSALKLLYYLTMPAFVLLGIHLAREIATSGGAPATVTDSLTTAFQVFMYIYLFTLGIFLLMVARNAINMFAVTTVDSIKAFRKTRISNKK